MANILVDPAIIVTPSDNASRDEVEDWINNLINWLHTALTAPFTWMHYQKASQLLEAEGQFPGFGQLRWLQGKYHLDVNITQVAKNVNAFFRDETFDLETTLKSLDYAIEPEIRSISIMPEQFITRLPECIRDDFHLLLADCCACKHINHPFGQQLCLATLALIDGSREIAVSVVIMEAVPDFARTADNKIAQTFPLLITPDDLQDIIDPIDIWAKGEQGIIYAIKQIYKKDQSGTTDTTPAFRLGPHFIESVNKRGLDTNVIVLRSIVQAASDVIAGRAKDIRGYRLHAFRKGETADSAQLIRDSDHARAWRLMLQKHGAGWRLHYWQIPTAEGSVIEFANICKESEREIYYSV